MYYDKLCDLGIKLTRHSGQEKTLCPQCSDGRKNKRDKCLSVNITTGEYNCHNCNFRGNVRGFERKREVKQYEKPSKELLAEIALKERTRGYLNSRGLSDATIDKFMIFSKDIFMPQTGQKENCICFPYFRDAEIINCKHRTARKAFRMEAGAELIFYNLNSLRDKKKAIITEGEIDCMSCYEAGFGGDTEPLLEYGVVSVPNGASLGNQKLEYLDNCADWFTGLDEIIIAVDGDEAGNSLKSELIRRLGVERCKYVIYPQQSIVGPKGGVLRPCKDLNEVLVHFGKEAVIEALMRSQSMPIDGVYYVEDIFGAMYDNFKKGIQLAPTTRFRMLDEYFRWKKGDINLFVGYANWGKTFYVLQLMLTKSLYDDWKWAVFSPENYPANDFYDDLVEMYCGKWLDKMTDQEYIEACEFLNDHIFYVYPENEHDIDSIHDKFRYLILKKGVDGVLIDPFNQLDHNQKAYQREDQYLADVLKDIKRFALLNSVSYNIITHPKNPKYEEGRCLPIVDMYDIAGGAMWGNKADQIVSYHRPRFHEDKNDPGVEVYLQKVKRKRTGGKLGHTEMKLIWNQKRYEESDGEIYCDPKRAAAFKRGETISEPPKQPQIIQSYKPVQNYYETEKDEFDGF